MNLDDVAKTNINQFIAKTASLADLRNSLYLLTQYLTLHHKVKPIIIMDEYDAPIHAAFANNFYRTMVDFMKHNLRVR